MASPRVYAFLSSAVRGGERFYFLDECRLSLFREPGRRCDTRGDRNSNLQKEFLLPGRRANTEHAYGLTRSIVKLMRSVGRNVQGFAGADDRILATEGGFHLAFENDKGLLEVMPVRWRTTAGRNVHVDDAEASGSLLAGHGNGVGIADQPDVRQVFELSKGEAAFGIVRRNCRLSG